MRRRATPLAPLVSAGPTTEVDSLKRGLELLREFTSERTGSSLDTLAARMEVPRATVQRLAATLGAFGFLRTIADTDRLEPDVGCLALGHALRNGMPLLAAAEPILAELAAAHRVEATLCVRDRLQVLVLEAAGTASIGALKPLSVCAAGHAILWATEAPLQGELLRRIREETPGLLGPIYRSFQAIEESGMCATQDPPAMAAPLTVQSEAAAFAIALNAVVPADLRDAAARIRAASVGAD